MVSKACFAWARAGVAGLYVLCAGTIAQAQNVATINPVDGLMRSMRSGPAQTAEISVVREAALRESATVYGAREGLRVQSCAIRAEIERKTVELDKRYRFGELMMGRGILPPVISEARDSVALDATVMRVASFVFHLDENARVVDVPPTWRDWLYVGLSFDACGATPVDVPGHEQLKPQNAAEEAFFRDVLTRSYEMGVQQAKDVLAANLARLERTYLGMRRYYRLYAQGMVSAPVIATSTDVVNREDPNTLIVGNTVIRITVPVDFVERSELWRPLGE